MAERAGKGIKGGNGPLLSFLSFPPFFCLSRLFSLCLPFLALCFAFFLLIFVGRTSAGAIESAKASQKIVNYQKDKYVLITNDPSLESCALSLIGANGEGMTLHAYPSGPFLSPVGRVRINNDLLFVEINGTENRQLDIYDLRSGARTPAKYGQYFISRNGRYVFSFDNDREGNRGLCLEYYRGKYVGLVLLKDTVVSRPAFRRDRRAREFLSFNALTSSEALVRKTINLTALVKEKKL
ncbi:MAG: hypothetical protein JW873_01680 [Candidatus Saganbacteria bacterium]|nr:hypothetical protein [Candidatus Saganbacteria bacterium]